jgi:hypothetical protein
VRQDLVQEKIWVLKVLCHVDKKKTTSVPGILSGFQNEIAKGPKMLKYPV